MRALGTMTFIIALASATGCMSRIGAAHPAPANVSVRPDSTFLKLCAEPPKPAPVGGVGCLLRYQVFSRY